MSHCWSPYLTAIPELLDEAGRQLYIHTTVNHTENFVDPDDGTHTNSVEGLWATAKARNRRYNGFVSMRMDV